MMENFSAMVSEHFYSAMILARQAMQDVHACGTYAHVFRACYFEDDADKVPATGKAIFNAFSVAFNGGQKMPILKTPIDCQCFLGICGNDVYRVLHDYDHFSAYKIGKGTTKLADEDRLNRIMVDRIMGAIHLGRGGIFDGIWCVLKACLLADLVGQSYYFAQKKAFIHNEKQLDFVRWTAEKILVQVMASGAADFTAITFPDFS